jgi:serine/threonine-protein phosphatase 6 regulatory ankyrin repeat subunit B
MAACHNGHAEIASLIIEKGAASIDRAEAEGWTALFLASQNGHLETVRLLVGKGASIDQADVQVLPDCPDLDHSD